MPENQEKPNKAVTQLRIDDVLFAKLKTIAEAELRSLNNQMEFFLMKSVQEYEEKNGEVACYVTPF